MPSTSTLLVFAAATLALLVVPGPSVVYVVARSLEHGRAAGLWSVLGLETGALLHVLGATAGLGALLASHPLALGAVRYAGAAYLVLMGVRQFLRRHAAPGAAGATPASRLRLFRDGVLVDLLNPKTALFFLAFLPQFVDPARGPVPLQVAVLGLCFVALALTTDALYALAAGALSTHLSCSAARRRRVGTTTAGVYVGLGGVAAFV
ncbi:LysE family translocator [Vallicoccus soli]|uniref:LysE family translocator n=1 Tax=Vallicoccus soli TaxID=2339232 RepID=A0A3A3Z492_9ACTN|nr:LysE family translocator [Vallicoccus soli]RJK96436.1 LysE family translocator [Vallicoccus soli]